MLDDSADLTLGDGAQATVNTGFSWLVRLSAISSIVVLFWMAILVFEQSWPAMQQFGLTFLTGTIWDINTLEFGALSFIYGTLATSLIALLLAIPISLAVAIITSENFLPDWVKTPIAFTVELIAAIPSVIIGFWGIFVFLPALLPFTTWLNSALGFIPFFNTSPIGPGILPAGIILAVMIVPTIAAISREVLLAIPRDLRSASSALGGTRWETIFRVMLPTGASGVLGAAVLGLGRALGETMAVTMVIGNAPNSPFSDPPVWSLLDSGATIPSIIALQFPEALDPLHIGALMYLAFVLFLVTLAVNVLAVLMVQFLNRGFSKNS
jgi:phosphate transport system permease protein